MSSLELNCLEFNYNCPHLAFLINDLHTTLRTKEKTLTRSDNEPRKSRALPFLFNCLGMGFVFIFMCISVFWVHHNSRQRDNILGFYKKNHISFVFTT